MTPDELGRKYGGVLERMVDLLGSTKGLSFGDAMAQACAEAGLSHVPPEVEAALLTASFKIIGSGRLPGAPDA